MQHVVLAAAVLFGTSTAATAQSDLNLLVFGDWGGLPIFPYWTLAERATARGLNRIGGEIGAAFALALGDNFYYEGVENLSDPRFYHTFENVYTGANLQAPDFFRVIAGNHDHNGNVSAEILYSGVSDRWHYPDYYYDFVESYGDGNTAHFIMLDTVVISGPSSDADGGTLTGSNYGGPQEHHVELADSQLAWLESTLSASTADHIIVSGHYPVWSICEHGPTSELLDQVKPLLEKYNASAYLSGHDHCAEVIDDGAGVVYHGIGSANFNDASTEHADAIPDGSLKFHVGDEARGGFASITLRGDTGGMVVTHYDGDGTKLYEAEEVAKRPADVKEKALKEKTARSTR
jgi:tartrate-resistant acid phosphatase type 5